MNELITAPGRARRRPWGLALLAAALLGLGLVPALAGAAAGQLDPSFGQGGQLFVDNIFKGLGEDGTSFNDLQRLPDGRLVALTTERCGMGCRGQLIARYLPTGEPDASFGSTQTPGVQGFRGQSDDGDGSEATGLVLRPDGGLVLGYQGGAVGSRLELVPPDGVSAPTVVPSEAMLIPDAVLPGGRVVVRSSSRVSVLRADLTSDPTVRALAIPPAVPSARRLAATANAIVVGGGERQRLVLWRAPLTGPRPAPVVFRLPRPTSGRPYSVFMVRQVLAGAGRGLVVAMVGRSNSSEQRTVIAAVDRAGRPDRRFGRDGILFLSQSDARVALQPNGKLVIASTYVPTPRSAKQLLLVRRLDARGRPDPTFDQQRLRTVANQFYGHDLLVDASGRVVVAGGAYTTFGSSGLLLVRLQAG